ncbi:MAG TPA: YfiR family protein [Bryobacteraceae bacterium]|jgi:hypothetical protein|nr:YfiR family protein [Bryobacteraceae bacterium]
MAKRSVAWLALLSVCCLAPLSHAGAEEGLEYQVKAAFLLNFTKFIVWPPSAFADSNAPLRICVLGDDPFGGALRQTVEGEVVNGRKLVAERIRRPPEAHWCQVLFISQDEELALGTLPETAPGVLTVGEGDRFLNHGGMIALIVADRRVRFDIDRAAAERAGLRISSRLLSVARSVR